METFSKKTFDNLYKKAVSYKEKKQLIKAIEVYSKIIEKVKDRENCVDCAKLYEDVGDIYYDIKDYTHAFEFMQKASTIYSYNKMYDLQLSQYKKLGGLQQSIWQFKKSIDIFQQGLMLANRLKLSDKIIEFELLIGNALNWDEQLEASEKYLKSAIRKEKKTNNANNSMIKLRAHVSYAILMRKMKKYDLSDKYFKLGMQFSKENNNAYMMDIFKSYGVLQYEKGNYEAAEKLLLQAEEMATSEGADTSRAVIFEYLSELYDKQRNYEKAFYYLRKFYDRKLDLLEKGYSDENNKLQIKLGLEDARRERAVAEETANAKSLFIAGISHEIRTPMNIILGTTSLMLNDHPKPEHLRYLQTLKKSGENLLGIINDILDVSKMEAGKLDVEMEPVWLPEIIENVATMMQLAATEKGLQLTYEIDSKIDFKFLSDGLRLNQIVTNLVSNAIKFTSVGSVHIQAMYKKKNELQIVVSDTGLGIPKDKLNSIFEQYEQVRTKTQKKYKGTGLGLSISKRLVELMQGTISVKSKVNIGTTFTVTLPIEQVQAQETVQPNAVRYNADFLNGKQILIVDDIDNNRFVIKETLKFFHPDVEILEVENGKQALDILTTTYPDLVIMDLDMPEMNGFEALSEIRKNKKTKNLKVVASTASVVANNEADFMSFGFNAYLPKPFNIEDFHALLQKQLASN
ncbi:MAG: ATP-binding protein [Chitinophagales bacterium]